MLIKRKIKNIICICIIILLIIVYLNSHTEKFETTPSNTDVNQNDTPVSTEPSDDPFLTFTNPDFTKGISNTNTPLNTDGIDHAGKSRILVNPKFADSADPELAKFFKEYKNFITNKKELVFALGPCLNFEITANNMNLLGIIVVGKRGDNIFNNDINSTSINDIDKIGNYITTPLSTTQTTSTNPEPSIVSNTKFSDLFLQTIYINNLSSCNFIDNTKDSNNNIILPCVNRYWSEIENSMKVYDYNHILDSTKMFRTPDNTQTKVLINLPQAPNQPIMTRPINSPRPTELFINNTHISSIILCLNSNIDNTIMLNSLKINVFGLNHESIAMWKINDVVDPSTNFLKFILYKPHTPIPTFSSNFININSNEKFLDILPESINIDMLSSSNTETSPSPNTSTTTTTSPNTTTTSPNTTTTSPNTTTTKPNTTTTSPNTTTTSPNITTTRPNTIELTDHGYKIPKKPYTNLFQRDFNGSSNIYSPYIYY